MWYIYIYIYIYMQKFFVVANGSKIIGVPRAYGKKIVQDN
jgi:hypothetical protein